MNIQAELLHRARAADITVLEGEDGYEVFPWLDPRLALSGLDLRSLHEAIDSAVLWARELAAG